MSDEIARRITDLGIGKRRRGRRAGRYVRKHIRIIQTQDRGTKQIYDHGGIIASNLAHIEPGCK